MSVTPTPETAAQIAAMIVPFAQQNYGAALDYSPESLRAIDGILDDLRRDQQFDQIQPLLFAFGCYLGEVLVRHAQGTWKTTADLGMSTIASSPIVIGLPDGRGCNPVGKVYKRFMNGPEDNLAWFYHVQTKAPETEK
jgi:hypothetical protein